jgi:hypothetical protein
MVESVREAKNHTTEVKRETQQERAEKFWQQTMTAGSTVQQASQQAQREEKKQTPSRKRKP